MKKSILLLLLSFSCFQFAYSQKTFNWDVIDSIPKSKDQIYLSAKSFIVDYWKSANNVIQLDDKENGIIVIKAVSVQKKFFQMNDHVYVFPYTVKFQMKNNKYRVIIENVHCESALCQNVKWPLLPITFEYPGYMKTSLSEKRFNEIMSDLHFEMENIISNFKTYISKNESTNNDW